MPIPRCARRRALSALPPWRRAVSGLAAAVLAGASLLVGAVPAVAHNSLTGSSPADTSTVTEPLTEVLLEFDQAVRTEFAQMAVLGDDQTPYQSGDPVVAGTTVTQAVQPLPDGAYTVSYRVVSADGHPITGAISFTATGQAPVAAEPPGPPAPAETETPSAVPTDEATPEPVAAEVESSPQAAVSEDEDGGLPAAALVGIFVAVAAGVAGAAYAFLARRPGADTGTDQADTGS
ncbi:MAG TPA: copper resistance CopC family protein [Jiangellales bacterium]|nr:copper resistance CopC family protein [Jiangellales bacterium]